MGSFDYNCAITGLPIEYMDDVMFLLLTKNIHKDDSCVYMTDWFFPRTFPLLGRYNDYGSIENVMEGPQKDLWGEGFKIDLIEKGVGDNVHHDVSIFKDSTFDEMLVALRERRIEVCKSFKPKGPIDDAYPTIRRVMEFLQFCGFTIGQDFNVDEELPGSIRVRYAQYGSLEEHLIALKYAEVVLCNQWSCMITVGSGAYFTPAELIVRPIPREGSRIYLRSEPFNPPSKVFPCMIRKDVWEAILTIPEYGKHVLKLDDFKTKIRMDWEKSLVNMKELIVLYNSRAVENLSKIWDLEEKNRCFFVNGYINSNLSHSVNLKTNWDLMLKKHIQNPFDDLVINQWLDIVAETCMVIGVLSNLRYWWRPSNSVGPQQGDWKKHEDFHRTIGNVISKRKPQWC